MSAPRKLNQTNEAIVVAKYKDGAQVSALVQEFGVSAGTVRAIVRRAGLATRKVGRPRKSVEA